MPAPNKRHFATFWDTDSREYFVDCDANRVIVKDMKILANVKVGGANTISSSIATTPVSLKSDCGKLSVVKHIPAVYVLSSPYNLISLQLFITHIKNNGYQFDMFLHDDQQYLFKYY